MSITIYRYMPNVKEAETPATAPRATLDVGGRATRE